MSKSHSWIALAWLVLASGCQDLAREIGGDAGTAPGDAAIVELPGDGGFELADGGATDAGSVPVDGGPTNGGEQDAGVLPHVRELGPGLSAYPLAPTVLIDTRGSAACGEIPALSVAHPAIKIDLARCPGIELPGGTGAIAISITALPRDPARETELRVGSSRITVGPHAPATHHVVARLAGSWLVIAGTGIETDVVVEIGAAFAAEELGASRVRLLPTPLRALSTIPDEPAVFGGPITPGTDRVIPVGTLARDAIGVPEDAITGLVAVVHVSPRAPCETDPFRISIGGARVEGEPLLTLGDCRAKAAPWSEGIVIGADHGELAVRLEGAEADVTIDVVGFLTTKWSGATLLYLTESPLRIGRDLDGPDSFSIPFRGVQGIAGSVHAWAAERAVLEVGATPGASPSVLVAPDRVDVAWIAAPVGHDGVVAIEGSAPMRAELAVDALFAFE